MTDDCLCFVYFDDNSYSLSDVCVWCFDAINCNLWVMATAGLSNVRDKISCVFETTVVHNAASKKRPDQPFQVVAAADRLRPDAAFLFNGDSSARPTEKLDGTCTSVREWNGRPWLWARHDRKPNKGAEKRFRAFTSGHRCTLAGGDEDAFVWNVETDFKDVPPGWTAAGSGLPDAGGHIPGWVPIDPKSRTHCWHLMTVDLEDPGVALVLQPRSDSSGLEITLVQLVDLNSCTLELIGTNINANPYHLGSRQHPIHFLVRHGILQIDADNLHTPESLVDWFSTEAGAVEGIVWHCANESLFKLHRHHLGLKWPIERPRLVTLPVVVNLESGIGSDILRSREFAGCKLIQTMLQLQGCTFPSLADLKIDTV